MGHFKEGHCSQCFTQVMVQDSNGRWNSYKPNFRQADLTYESGSRVRVIVCENCLENPDCDKIVHAITHCNSNACSTRMAERIKGMGKPISLILAAKAKQGVRLGMK